jgi:hypothetical protein
VARSDGHVLAPGVFRKRVGMSHHPLADVLNAFAHSGLAIEHVAELGDRPLPGTCPSAPARGRDPCLGQRRA